MINRQNYEVYFLDFLEGNLSEEQVASVQQFLAKNPDLEAELAEMELITLPKTKISFPDKNQLKKVDLALSELDQLLIAQLENELTPTQQTTLNQRIYQNPLHEKEQKLYQLTQMSPDLSVIFPNKNRLKKTDKKIISLRFILQTAAMILLLVAVIFALSEKTNQPELPMVEVPTNVPYIENTTDLNKPIEYISPKSNTTKAKEVKPNRVQVVITMPSSPSHSNNTPSVLPDAPKTIPKIEELVHHPIDTTINHPPTLKKEQSIPKPVLAFHHPTTQSNSQSSPTKTIVYNLNQPKQFALNALTNGVQKLTGQENIKGESLSEIVINVVEIASKQKVKIEEKETQKRKRFGISIGRFGFSHSRSM